MKTPSLIFHTLRLTFLQEAIFPETPQGSQQGRLLSKVDRFFFVVVVVGDLWLLFRQSPHWPWTQTQFGAFFLFCAAFCFCVLKSTVCETRFTKEPYFDRAFVQISAGEGAGGLCSCVSGCAWTHQLCHSLCTFRRLFFIPQALRAKVRRWSSVQVSTLPQPNVVRGKQSFWRWRGDQSDLPPSPATCVMCLLACLLFNVSQVDKPHNPSHLI